jgi:hypothetical protein
MNCHAAARDVEIASIESSLEIGLDLQGLPGLPDDVREGYGNISVTLRARTSNSDAAGQLEELTTEEGATHG